MWVIMSTLQYLPCYRLPAVETARNAGKEIGSGITNSKLPLGPLFLWLYGDWGSYGDETEYFCHFFVCNGNASGGPIRVTRPAAFTVDADIAAEPGILRRG